jgi:hypothetical protein
VWGYEFTLPPLLSMSDSKGYHGVHAHMIGTGETAAQQWCVLSIEKQHVEGRGGGVANSYRWWCFGYRLRQSCDIARPQGNCVALRLPLHNCGAMVPTLEYTSPQT